MLPVRLLKTIAGLRSYLEPYRTNQTIGLVPTMGGLHAGHLSLIERAIKENDLVVVSIYVNPLQFGPKEDLEAYPRNLDADCQLCAQLGVGVVFAPDTEEMGMGNLPGIETHSPATTTVMPPAQMLAVLCAPFRPDHFPGVATAVTKLLNIVEPTKAYFGQKDAQQLAIIRYLVRDFNLPVEIQACATVREASGLACSSRNQYLTPEQKQQAVVLSKSLQLAQEQFNAGTKDSLRLLQVVQEQLATVPDLRVEYVELVDPHTLLPLPVIEKVGLLAIAAWLGPTRLIDNVVLRQPSPIIAIDGPAGAGKSTVARRVAQALGLLYLDTGAMYRAITWLVLASGIATDDESGIAELVSQADLQLQMAEHPDTPIRVLINGEDITQAIRTPKISASVSAVAKSPAVRQVLVEQQRQWGEKGGLVAEGRDIGTNVFPYAKLKIFLTASVQERAKRRFRDLQNQGEQNPDLAALEHSIRQRDHQDSTRKLAPLCKAPSAIEINTDGLTIEEVVKEIIKLYSAHK